MSFETASARPSRIAIAATSVPRVERAKTLLARFARPSQGSNAGKAVPRQGASATFAIELAATLEVWGDCELFGGAASNGILNLTQAAENYDEARNLAADAGHAAVLGCKLVIADWLNKQGLPRLGGNRRIQRRSGGHRRPV